MNKSSTEKDVNDSKLLDIKFKVLVSLVDKCIKDIRKQRPETVHNYCALVRYYKEKGKVKHEAVGFIRNRQTLNKLISYIYHSDFIKENYDKKTVEEFAKKLFVDYAYQKKLTKNKIAEKIVKHFEKIHIWKIIFPLDNIVLKIPYFKLGNHKIVKFNNYQRKKWREYIKNYFKSSQYPQNLEIQLKWFDRDYNRFLKDNVCAIIQVKTGDSKRAMDEAKKEFQVFLNCLKYMSFRWYHDYKSRRILIPGQNYDKIASFIGFSETAGSTGVYENKKPFPFEIDNNINKRMHEFGLYKINEILNIDENTRTHFQKIILNSLKLYGDAISDFDLSQSIVKLVTILEYLLIQGREPKSHNLAERLSFLMRKNYLDRNLYYEHIRLLYNLRSDIVHEAKTDVTKKDYEAVHTVVYNLLLLLINIHHKFENKKDFLSRLGEIKFGRTYTFQREQVYISPA
jgi:hypothetical protein